MILVALTFEALRLAIGLKAVGAGVVPAGESVVGGVVGTVGRVNVNGLEATDGVPVPVSFVAETVQVYVWPAERSVMFATSDDVVVLRVVPPVLEVHLTA